MKSQKATYKKCLTIILCTILFAAFCLAAPSFAQQDRITQIQVVAESMNEVRLQINYSYSGSHGTDVFMSAKMATKGETSQHYGYQPARVQVGSGSASVSLSSNSSAPDLLTSDELIIEMYVGGGSSFLKQSFQYFKTWTKPGHKLLPVYKLIQPIATLVTPIQPAKTVRMLRRIKPLGVAQLSYTDGTKKLIRKGGIDVEHPDGSHSMQPRMNTQPATPPSTPPDNQHFFWLQSENGSLLEIISMLVGNDEESIKNYLTHEGDESSFYEKINSRTDMIEFLLTPL